MAISESRKQKKLQQKRKKRKSSGKPPVVARGPKVLTYAKHPVHECLVPRGLFENGIGTIIWTRRTPHGSVAVSVFLVDVFCLGVKNAFFRVDSKQEYERSVRPGLIASHHGEAFHTTDPACVRKLIEGAVDYAEALGFHPHPDYREAKALFGDVDGTTCTMEPTYGHQGKPFYIRGPGESMLQARRIVEQLAKRCGEGGFDYRLAID